MCNDYYPESKQLSIDERIDKLENQCEEILTLLTKLIDFLHNFDEMSEKIVQKGKIYERNADDDELSFMRDRLTSAVTIPE